MSPKYYSKLAIANGYCKKIPSWFNNFNGPATIRILDSTHSNDYFKTCHVEWKTGLDSLSKASATSRGWSRAGNSASAIASTSHTWGNFFQILNRERSWQFSQSNCQYVTHPEQLFSITEFVRRAAGNSVSAIASTSLTWCNFSYYWIGRVPIRYTTTELGLPYILPLP